MLSLPAKGRHPRCRKGTELGRDPYLCLKGERGKKDDGKHSLIHNGGEKNTGGGGGGETARGKFFSATLAEIGTSALKAGQNGEVTGGGKTGTGERYDT